MMPAVAVALGLVGGTSARTGARSRRQFCRSKPMDQPVPAAYRSIRPYQNEMIKEVGRHMRLRLSVISAAASVAISVGLGLGASTAASAGVTATGVPASVRLSNMNSALKTTEVTPDISKAWLYPRQNEQGGGTTKECLEESDPLVVPPVASVKNNCEYRIYLQQVDGGTSGWSFCINPHATVNIPSDRQNPRGLLIGRPEACGA